MADSIRKTQRTTSPKPARARRTHGTEIQIGARLRIVLGKDIAIGPGKADILEGIRETGSIAAAGRGLGMSYKRAWLLVESMNRCFKKPLVEATKGGHAGGGAHLSALGEEVLQRYRSMQTLAEAAIAGEVRAMLRLLARPSAK